MDEQTLNWLLTFGAETGGLIQAQQEIEGVGVAGAEAGAVAAGGFAEMGDAALAAGTITQEEMAASIAEVEALQMATAAAGQQQVVFGEEASVAGEFAAAAAEKVTHHLEKMMVTLFLVQLVLKGFEEVVKTNESFQQLKASFSDLSESAIDALGPALTIVAKALTAILTVSASIGPVVKGNFELVIAVVKGAANEVTGLLLAIGDVVTGNYGKAIKDIKSHNADAIADFKGVGDQYIKGFKSVEQGFKDAYDGLYNTSKKYTKEQEGELALRVKDEIAHNNDLLKIRMAQDAEHLKNKYLSNAQIKALYQDEGDFQLETLKKNEDLELQVLKAKLAAKMITISQYNNQVFVLEQATASKEILLKADTSSKKQRIDDAETDAMLKNIESVSQAGAQAFAKTLQQTHDLEDATRAAAGAMIKTAADEAAKMIEIKGLEAAAQAFQQAPNIYVGAAEAAGVLAWYSGLAAGVGAVGGALSSAVSGTSSSSASTSSSATASTTSTTATPTSSTAAQAAATAASGAGGGGTGPGVLNLTILLDSSIIAKAINQMSYNGQMSISMKCLVP
jgi:hypothetical protein